MACLWRLLPPRARPIIDPLRSLSLSGRCLPRTSSRQKSSVADRRPRFYTQSQRERRSDGSTSSQNRTRLGMRACQPEDQVRIRPPKPESGSATVPMMQAADLRNRNDPTPVGRFDLSFDWRVTIKRQVRPPFVVIPEVGGVEAVQRVPAPECRKQRFRYG